jgi:hypothetical protein
MQGLDNAVPPRHYGATKPDGVGNLKRSHRAAGARQNLKRCALTVP